MIEVLFIVLLLSVSIASIAIVEDFRAKGFKLDPNDGDGDGKVQDGTRWERKKR
jgi:hypothetical protein